MLVVGGRPPEGPATESLEDTLLRLLQAGCGPRTPPARASDPAGRAPERGLCKGIGTQRTVEKPIRSDTLE